MENQNNDDDTILTTDQARQGQSAHTRYILLGSLALAVVVGCYLLGAFG